MEEQQLRIKTAGVNLEGNLCLPAGATGLVIFVHGSGSSRLSPRNLQVARYLTDRGLGTLLFDLLTARENSVDEFTREYRFNIPLLSERLVGVLDWLSGRKSLKSLKIGLFGASTGAAAALIGAAQRPAAVTALVSRGGRPDLAGQYLRQVQAPSLLIVGGYDEQVIELNEEAAAQLHCPHEIAIVPGATHLFEEPGKLEAVCSLAGDWFVRYLSES